MMANLMTPEILMCAEQPKSSAIVRVGAIILLLFLAACTVPTSRAFLSPLSGDPLTQVGIASWYGPGFHGKPTASGTIYDQNEFTAAHQTLPLGTRLMVT